MYNAERRALDACGTKGYVLRANGYLHACPLERAWPLAHPTSRLGEIVPLGDSQMERLRKNILLVVIEAIALRGTIEGLFEKRITMLADLPQGGIKGVWRYWSRKDQTPIDKGYRFLCRR
jgi:hypothetical protein